MSLIKNVWVRRIVLILVFVSLFAGSAYLFLKARKLKAELRLQKTKQEATAKEKSGIKDDFNKLLAEYAKLQSQFKDLSADRDNLAMQNSGFNALKARVQELEGITEKLKKDLEAEGQKSKDLLDENLAAKDKEKDLQAIQKQLIKEKEQLADELARVKDQSMLPKLQEENKNLLKSKTDLSLGLKLLRTEADKLKYDNTQLNSELKAAQEKEKRYNSDYAEAVKKNKTLEQRVIDAPGKFAEIARQNKALIRQTANMHYNYGVFYLKQKEYTRAVAEFEKAVELTPDDAYAQFNLGYIYAEYIVDRPKAIEHFRQYLRLAKKEDKDADWVRKYILTWQTWQGKEPLE